MSRVDVEEEKCELCGTPASPGAAYCVACGEALKRKTASVEQKSQAPHKSGDGHVDREHV
jgi:predicted amidophosphoribosyltransferase